MLLFICLVNNILFITKMIDENKLNIYAFCHKGPLIWKPLLKLFPVPSTSCDLCTCKVRSCYTQRFRRRCIYKVRKRAKISNQYNQVPHLTQDTNGKVTNSQLDVTNESQEVGSFPASDHKAHINRRVQKHSKHMNEKT